MDHKRARATTSKEGRRCQDNSDLLKVNKFVINGHSPHGAARASEIIWSLRGFGRAARYHDAERGRPGNGTPADAGPEDFTPFPFKRGALHGGDQPGQDNKRRGAKITDPKPTGPLSSQPIMVWATSGAAAMGNRPGYAKHCGSFADVSKAFQNQSSRLGLCSLMLRWTETCSNFPPDRRARSD